MGETFYRAALIIILVPYGLMMLVFLWNEFGPSIRTHVSKWQTPSSRRQVSSKKW